LNGIRQRSLLCICLRRAKDHPGSEGLGGRVVEE
jgi:hypothetical protein